MSFNISLVTAFSDGSNTWNGTTTTTADAVAKTDFSATLSATVTADFSYKATAQKCVYFLLSGMNAGDTVTLTTYSQLKGAQSGALDTITLTNGVPYQWISGNGTSPLQAATNVLSVKVVNAVARTGTVDLIVGYTN